MVIRIAGVARIQQLRISIDEMWDVALKLGCLFEYIKEIWEEVMIYSRVFRFEMI